MAKLFGRKYTKAQLLARTGDIAQLAGVRMFTYAEGRAKGVAAAEFKTGSGFRFTTLLDRGLDIGEAEWCGRPLAWHSSAGVVHPHLYDPHGTGWIRGFGGGLMTTCGLTNTGPANVDQGESLGVHGRASYLQGFDLSHGTYWDDDDYVMFVEGSVRETRYSGENLLLRRRISAVMGEDRLFLDDIVTNEGARSWPLMLLYHVNPGFPVVDAGAQLLAPSREVVARDEIGAKEIDQHATFIKPTRGYAERVYYHRLQADREGRTVVGVANMKKDGRGLGVYVRFRPNQLPHLAEWKMMGERDYVVGIEPTTNRVGGRADEREAGRLQSIEPGESRHFNLEIGALTSEREINALRREVNKLR
jgi:hypothetical protein